MATIHIDGKSVEVDKADNLLQACLSLGIDVPYFCYHPALGSVGSCRQCAVKQYNNEDDYKAGRGRLVMSCMVAPSDDMYISVDDDEAKTFRKHIVEYLMTNHPHDCPTCEEGGHCHLQDMTYMSGQNRRRYRFTKRTHHNQDLGAFINHEMNRCIACYRCVRFYTDYAGGTDFGVYASANRVYFGRETDGQLQSEFSGNLTEVCPTGVFTDKTHSDRYNRKWDMQYAPSICHGCSGGCNISAGERYGELRRIENRYNPDVNGYFLCDKGRFGYGYVNRADRPLLPSKNSEMLDADSALDELAALFNGKRVLGIGSARASLESNFALKRLVGDEFFSTGERLLQQNLIAQAMDILRHKDVYNLSMMQIENADAVLILGEDLTQTASRVALSVRQAAKNKALQMAAALKTDAWLAEPVKRIGQMHYSPVYNICVNDTKLDDISKVSAVATPTDIAKLGFLVGEIIAQFADNLPAISDSKNAFFAKEKDENYSPSDDEAMLTLAHHIAYDLIMADKPLVISGTSLLSADVLQAAGFIATTLSAKREQIKRTKRASAAVESAKILADTDTPMHDADKLARPENHKTPANVQLESQVVRHPDDKTDPLPNENPSYVEKAGVYMVVPAANSIGVQLLGGLAVEEALAVDFDAVLVLENDLHHFSDEQRAQLFAKPLAVLDHEHYAWHKQALMVLPAASFAEGDGTLVSAEGRAQRFFAAYDKRYYVPNSDIKDSWRWLGAMGCELHDWSMWRQLDEVLDDLAHDYPDLAGAKSAAPLSDYRITGLKIAREPRRYSGRTAMRAKLSVHEPMQPKDADSALTFSMEGYVGDKTPAAAIAFAYAAGWNSPQAWNSYQNTVGGRLKGGDVGVRLFDTLAKSNTAYCKKAVQAPKSGSIFTGIANLVPVYHMFASSDMAYRSPVVASQLTAPVWTISAGDAETWQVKTGDKLAISQGTNADAVVLPVLVQEYLAQGCIGYLPGQVPLVAGLPAWVQKVAQDTPITEPYYMQASATLVGVAAPSLSAFNAGKLNKSFVIKPPMAAGKTVERVS